LSQFNTQVYVKGSVLLTQFLQVSFSHSTLTIFEGSTIQNGTEQVQF